MLLPEKARKTFSVRLFTCEYEIAKQEAFILGKPVAEHMRDKIIADNIEELTRLTVIAKQEFRELAQILVILGKTRVASNLNQIAKAIHTGTLVLSPSVVAQIIEACEDIRQIRRLLTTGLVHFK